VLRGPEHRFEFVNDAYLELVDWRPLAGLPIRDALPELADQGIYELLDGVYASGEAFHTRSMRLIVEDSEGTPQERFFDFVYQPTLGPDRRPNGIAVVVYDVSALTEARRQADHANRVKDEFLAMLGHELRNPLAPIVTVLHVMRQSAAQPFVRERAILERQVERLVRLVDDLLDISRIASGKVELRKERFDLRDAVNISLEAASPEFDRHRHRVATDIDHQPLWVHGDAARLAQVVSNLLVNAAKYTPPGGKIELTARQVGKSVELRVIDNGIGISAELLPQVFDLFVQERQAADRTSGGLGLGLAIVKSLVRAHGGQVSASSAGEGKGSEFGLMLPVAGEEQPAAMPAASLENRAMHRPLRVLIVDDNADAGQSLADVLELHGIDTQVAVDGPSALDIAETFNPQVAILDIGLPVMDGYELARRLKVRHAGVRLLALTGYGDRANAHSAQESGFEARLIKPVALDALVARLFEAT
jgi:signal transduction histidine kinase/CheY-like chemotaxis protein